MQFNSDNESPRDFGEKELLEILRTMNSDYFRPEIAVPHNLV